MKVRSLLGILLSLALLTSFQTSAQTLEELMKESKIVGAGSCLIQGKSMVCYRFTKKNKEYLLIMKKDGEPHMIISTPDGTVVWIAGTYI